MPFTFRERTLDEWIYARVVHDNEYLLPDWISGVVIDVGAHIGSFTHLALERGANTVLAFEPDAENYKALCANLKEEIAEGRVQAYNMAVWRSDVADLDTLPTLYFDPYPSLLPQGFDILNTGGNTLQNRPVPGGSPPITVVPLDAILKNWTEISYLKLDCESSEFPILLTSHYLNRVHWVVGESHDMHPIPPHFRVGAYQSYTLETLIRHMRTEGFKLYRSMTQPGNPFGLFWFEFHPELIDPLAV